MGWVGSWKLGREGGRGRGHEMYLISSMRIVSHIKYYGRGSTLDRSFGLKIYHENIDEQKRHSNVIIP